MLPILELRGAIPLGFSLGFPWWLTFLVSVVGNLVPVPFIIVFIRRIFLFLKERFKWAEKLYNLEKRAMAKADYVYKYSLLGLAILVAIPLPGTGAWTGALLAALLDLRLKNAFPAVVAGVLVAGFIMTMATYGVSSIFQAVAG